MPAPASLVLISPAIGVSPSAALARWIIRMSHLPGLERMAQRIRLQVRDIRAVGEDWRITAGLANQDEAG